MNYNDLHPGDIILFKHHNELFHVAIFAPEKHRVSDLIDATSNKGVTRGTLEGLYKILAKCTQTSNLCGVFSNRVEISVVRSKQWDGQAIADQADFWRIYGLTYDVGSLAHIVEKTAAKPSKVSTSDIDKNLQTYRNYAKRANKPLLDNPIEPSALAVFCSFYLTPIWNFPQLLVLFFVRIINFLTKSAETEAKGVNCGGFVLATLAAVALKDKDLNEEEQCKEILGKIAEIDPKNYSLITLMDEVFADEQLFEDKGILDTTKLSNQPFNKDVFHKERQQDALVQTQLNYALSM